jgi:hypothetical protein
MISFCLCDRGSCQNDPVVNQLKQLNAAIGQAKAPIIDSTMDDVAKKFILILPSISLEPDYKALPNMNEITPNGVMTIKDATEIALALIRSQKIKTVDKKAIDSPSLIALDIFITKLNRAIDPNWKMLFVTANVSPAPGTPNAAAGMNPEAIADPLLKKKYLDLIKKNRDNSLKNGQQRALRESRDKFLRVVADLVSTSGEGWSKADVLLRFGKDEESKKILETYLKQSE